MTKQEIINEQVKARLARANTLLIKKNGVDPNDIKYIYRKQIIRYAFDHNMTLREAIAYHRKDAYKMIEKQLGRPLRNTSQVHTGYKKAVWNPLTGERWSSIVELAQALKITPCNVRYAINNKNRLYGQFIEYVQ